MKKTKLQEKYHELIEHENRSLAYAKDLIGQKSHGLQQLGLDIHAFLMWEHFAEEDIYLERIGFCIGYVCTLVVKIYKQGEDPTDIDLKNIGLFYPLSYITSTFFLKRSKPIIRPIDELNNVINKFYNDVLKKGYDAVLAEMSNKM